MKSYCEIEELRELFKDYMISKESNLTEKEYKLFCSWLQYLPKEIIGRILSDIYFCLLSYENHDAACYIPLHTPYMAKKKGIIVIPQALFGCAIDMPGKENVEKKFLHEVAHFICCHTGRENPPQAEIIELEANILTDRWMLDYSVPNTADGTVVEEMGEN